jgi:hypothetical protein
LVLHQPIETTAVTGEVERREESSLKFIKVLGVVLLCIASLAVLLAVVIPTAAILFLSFLGKGLESTFHSLWRVLRWLSIQILGFPSLLVWGCSLFSAGQFVVSRGACDQTPDKRGYRPSEIDLGHGAD